MEKSKFIPEYQFSQLSKEERDRVLEAEKNYEEKEVEEVETVFTFFQRMFGLSEKKGNEGKD